MLFFAHISSFSKTDKRALRAIAEIGADVVQTSPPLDIVAAPSTAVILSSSSSKSTLSVTDKSSLHKSLESVEVLDEKPVLDSGLADQGSIEKGYPWDGYLEDPIPDKTQAKWARNARHQIFSLYRRLFGVIFVVNIVILIVRLAQGGLSSPEIGKIAIANIFCAILMRQDHVVNAFFAVFCAVPPS